MIAAIAALTLAWFGWRAIRDTRRDDWDTDLWWTES